NTRNQAVIQDGRVDIQTKNAGYGGNSNKIVGRQNRNQAFNAGTGNDERNQNVQLNGIVKTVPSYDAKAASEVNASSKDHEQNIMVARNFRGCGRKSIENEKQMVQINYGKLNALYETFVPQQESSVKQTKFLIPSTSNIGSESKEVTSDLPISKMSKESKLLKMFDKMGVAINGLRTRIDITLLGDRQRRWMSNNQNSLRDFYKTNVILMPTSFSKSLKELHEELIEEVHEMLSIFESMEQKVDEKSSKEITLQKEID
ncbi:hypothetical protein Tco_1023644, partial [Tanacetum coccineum]